MPRPPFEPNSEQQKVIRSIENLAEQRRLITAQLGEIDAQTDKLIAEAEQLEVPKKRIAEAAKRTRKTVYRHLGKPMK